MDESGNKGMELNCRDAKIRKSSISRISVEGYDTSLRRADVDGALREHFASCGNIIHVYVPVPLDVDVNGGILCRYSLIYVNEEDEEKALKLDGSDMGGRILQINPYPFHENHLDDYLAPMKEGEFFLPQHTIMVKDFESSLPIDVIMEQLDKYFSSKGSFVYQDVTASGAIKTVARFYVRGQEGVDTALERSGRSVEGLYFVVTRVVPVPAKIRPTGYCHPNNFIEDPNITEKRSQKKKKKKSKTTERNQSKKKEKKRKSISNTCFFL
ncbi:uncharacterized protein LOC108806288 [Raphanus sativus]|uniref:Uncharacterized protein LOC108806288 n=1 Tax=Raphanus sativus TaxID=3726 RepID=A0A6J0JE19_RAPSA|nr:uncharacterized protein LOC108806288 [Raphanus sativus]